MLIFWTKRSSNTKWSNKIPRENRPLKWEFGSSSADHFFPPKKFFRLIFQGWIFWDGVFALLKMPRISLLPSWGTTWMSPRDFLHRHALPFVHLCMFVCMYVMFCYITLDYIKLHYVISLCCVMLCYAIECNVLQLCNAPEWNVVWCTCSLFNRHWQLTGLSIHDQVCDGAGHGIPKPYYAEEAGGSVWRFSRGI